MSIAILPVCISNLGRGGFYLFPPPSLSFLVRYSFTTVMLIYEKKNKLMPWTSFLNLLRASSPPSKKFTSTVEVMYISLYTVLFCTMSYCMVLYCLQNLHILSYSVYGRTPYILYHVSYHITSVVVLVFFSELYCI